MAEGDGQLEAELAGLEVPHGLEVCVTGAGTADTDHDLPRARFPLVDFDQDGVRL